ncbi:MAG: ABC transporter ATP-binding protein [Candidatus Methanoplasma sp.]|jgi:zinc transport system ATP-binding protein|nr:ABC transporter ATP-binding protein [Candidatus Methanoplasma sp.]
MEPIEVSGLTAGYGGRAVIEGVSLELRERDYLAVIGPNGGGKSTLLKAVLGLIEPMGGRISVFGASPAAGSKRIGYVPQRGTFDRTYPITVMDAVLMGLRARKGMGPVYSSEHRAMARSAMESAGVSDLAERKVGDLSGGQTQRVLLARALAPGPDALLLDEPTASLDPSMTGCVHDILRRVSRDIPVMIVTHDIGAVARDVKRIACLNRRIVVSDSPEITPEMMAVGFCCPPEILSRNRGCGCSGKCTCGRGGGD